MSNSVLSASRITVRGIPDVDAPIAAPEPNDWLPRRPEHGNLGYVQGHLSLAHPVIGGDPHFGPQPTRASHLPEPQAWSQNMIRAALEVMDGLRPASQLARWLTPEVHERISRRGLLARRRRQRQQRPSTVRSVHVCEPIDGVAEVAAVVVYQNRVRAVAMRMTGVDGRWKISVLQVG